MLAKLTMHCDHSQFAVDCHALEVWDNYENSVLAMSVAGSDTAIKAIRAVLHEKQIKADFRAEGIEDLSSYARLHRWPAKYDTLTARLGLNTVHLVALAQVDGILRSVTDEALWQELRSERFTTPFLRHWTPWIKEQLTEQNKLKAANCFGCNVGAIGIKPDDLDKLVCLGVATGELTMTKGRTDAE